MFFFLVLKLRFVLDNLSSCSHRIFFLHTSYRTTTGPFMYDRFYRYQYHNKAGYLNLYNVHHLYTLKKPMK